MNSTSSTPTGRRDHDVGDAIEVVVPLRPEHGATLRVVATSLCADAGFSIDEIDDVKLGVSEFFTLLLDEQREAEASRAHLEMRIAHHAITVNLHRGVENDIVELDPMAGAIISSIADEYSSGPSGLTFTKRASEAAR